MKIQSVLGPIDTADLGQTLMHEHVTCADWSMRMNFGRRFFEFDRVAELAEARFSKVKRECGVRTIVDGTAVNLGRDAALIQEVSRRTGLNFIASSGFYYQEEPWLAFREEDQIYDLLLTECREGIADTGVLPGMMKAGVAKAGVTPLLHKVLSATSRAAAACGLPVFCHHDPSVKSGGEILDLFESRGTDPSRVILGHSGDTDDITYLEEMLKRGCWLGMDRFGFCDRDLCLERRVEAIAALCEMGYGNRLLLSHDLAAYLAFWDNWEEIRDTDPLAQGVDFTFVHKTVLPALKAAGVSQKQLDAMLTENPRAFFEGTN